MKSEKLIAIRCQTVLGTMPDLSPTNKILLAGLDSQFKGSVVARTFELWAQEHKHDGLRKPISAFLKEAEELLGSTESPTNEVSENPVVKRVSREIAYLTDNQIALGPKHKLTLLSAIEEENYTYEEVMAAFREFFQNLDTSKPTAISFAPKNFTDEAADRLYAVRRKAAEKAAEEAAVRAAGEELARRASEEVRARLAALEAEKQESEEELPE